MSHRSGLISSLRSGARRITLGANKGSRGGDGQTVEFGVRTGLPRTLHAAATGTMLGASGLAGGEAGATGHFLVNGVE